MNTTSNAGAAKAAPHTPTPWRYVKTNGSPTSGQHMIAGSKPGYLAEIRDCGSGDVSANAAFIVRAVNAHDELVAALHRIAAVEPCEGKAAKNRDAMLQMQAIAHFALVKAGAL